MLLLRDELLGTVSTEGEKSETPSSPTATQTSQHTSPAKHDNETPALSGARVLTPQLFDPAFSDIDLLLIHTLGLAVLGTNEGGARPVHQPTMFYLPHCEVSWVLCPLYVNPESLLAACCDKQSWTCVS